jgi:hypothetical protein
VAIASIQLNKIVKKTPVNLSKTVRIFQKKTPRHMCFEKINHSMLGDTIYSFPIVKSNCTHAVIKEDEDQMDQTNNNKRRLSEDKYLSYFDMETNNLLLGRPNSHN